MVQDEGLAQGSFLYPRGLHTLCRVTHILQGDTGIDPESELEELREAAKPAEVLQLN